MRWCGLSLAVKLRLPSVGQEKDDEGTPCGCGASGDLVGDAEHLQQPNPHDRHLGVDRPPTARREGEVPNYDPSRRCGSTKLKLA